MSSFKRLADAGDLTGKTALVRVDFNVPMENGLVTDDTRLRAAVDTVQTLRTQGAKVALLAHFGRPKGERVAEMSLAPVAGAFGKVLGYVNMFLMNYPLRNGAQLLIHQHKME